MADETKRKPFWARALLVAAGAAVLFTAGLTTTLAVRGKLGAFLAPMLGMPEAVAGVPTTPEGGAPPTGAATSGPTFILPSPFSSPEASLLLDELGSARDEAQVLRAKLERERHDLELIRADLDLRWDELDRREALIEEREKQLQANGAELGGRGLAPAPADEKALKSLAESVEKMKPTEAVEVLRKMPASRVAEILKKMKARESGRILEAFDPEFAAEIIAETLGAPNPQSPPSKP